MKASSLTSALVVRKGGALPSVPTPQAFARRPANPPTPLPTRPGPPSPTVEAPRQNRGGANENHAASAIAFGQRKATATAPMTIEARQSSRKHHGVTPDATPATGSGRGRNRHAHGGCGGIDGGRCNTGGQRVRMTLRMDARDHLRLKLAAAHSGKNMTRLIDEAIDSYLAAMGPLVNGGYCACLAGRAAGSGPGPDGGNDAA